MNPSIEPGTPSAIPGVMTIDALREILHAAERAFVADQCSRTYHAVIAAHLTSAIAEETKT